jgi:hypothetical protein
MTFKSLGYTKFRIRQKKLTNFSFKSWLPLRTVILVHDESLFWGQYLKRPLYKSIFLIVV